MTSTAVRWVLVEGTTGEGAPTDRGVLDIAAMATFDADGLLDALLDDEVTVAESRVHAIGVTWSSDAEAAASTVLQALAARDLENVVVAVSEIEAAEALASGIADIAGYDDVAVCVVEPDAAVVAMVNAEEATVDRIDRSLDRADAVDLTSSVVALLDLDDRPPDAIFVIGSDDLDVIVSSLAAIADSPVISAAEADLALARGAALASAMAVNTLDAQAARVRPRWMSRTAALTSVVGAAVVTFVVSLSVALGLQFTPDSGSEHPQIANAADEPAPAATPPSVARAAPQRPPPAAPPPPPPPAAPPPEALPPVAETIPVAAPPVPEVAAAEPVFEPPAAAPVAPPPVYQPIAPPPVYEPIAPPPAAPPPAPVYVPPAPAYVPPAPAPPPVTYPKPRLRDRIIERIPIIRRFHEPELQYPR